MYPKSDPKSSVTGKMKTRYWWGRRKAESGVAGGRISAGVLARSWRVACESVGERLGESGARSLVDGDDGVKGESGANVLLGCIDGWSIVVALAVSWLLVAGDELGCWLLEEWRLMTKEKRREKERKWGAVCSVKVISE